MDIHHKPFLFTGRLLLLCVVIVLASFALYLSLSLWAGKGEPLLPLDDVYIHFQYARQLAFGQPNVYNPGQPPSSGATSFIYPVFLAIGYLLGFQEMWLGLWALLLGAFAQMLVLVAILRWAMSWSLSSAWTALLLLLDRLGVSGTVLWTAFTGFAAVAAVAFFAAWSVLSNIFCALLIFTTRPFGLRDHVELLESGDKPGLGGEVMDINLIYTTLKETVTAEQEPTYLRVPNSLFFQRATRLRTTEAVVRSLLD